MKNISSKEFVTQFEKLKKLYETNILTFTEFTEQKEQRINELKNLIIHESIEDFLIEISILFQQNYINDEELNKIKKILFAESRCIAAEIDIADNKIETPKPVLNINNDYSIKIGNQIWMSKNLNIENFRNGDPIPQVQDAGKWSKLTTGAWCYYNNDPANGNKYGKLYNWFAVNDPRGLAPKGWHIPSDAEWAQLTDYLGGESVAGGKMKATTLWDSPNTGATNSSGFTAFPGGVRSNYGDFSIVGGYGYFWSSSVFNAGNDIAWDRNLGYGFSDVYRGYDNKKNGLSVRCVKD